MYCRPNKNKQKQNRIWPYFSTDAEKKHGQRECPLDVVRVCPIFSKDHDTEQFPLLPGLKVVFRGAEEEIEPFYLMAQCRQWQAHPPNTLQDPSFFSGQYNQQQNSGNAWQS
jgi:hypothetical protein